MRILVPHPNLNVWLKQQCSEHATEQNVRPAAQFPSPAYITYVESKVIKRRSSAQSIFSAKPQSRKEQIDI